MSRGQSVHRTAIAVSLLFIAAATLVPNAADPWPTDFWSWHGDTIEFALNVVLFAPLGAALAPRANATKSLLAIAALTLGIELLQYFVITGRDGAIRDVVANCGGGMLGFIVARRHRSLWRPGARTARRLAWTASVLWILHAMLAMVAFRPSVTKDPLYTHLAPDLGQYDRFGGTVAQASVNGATVFIGRFPAGVAPTSWESHAVQLMATTTTAPTTVRLAPVVALIDSAGNEIALLAELRGALVFRMRTLAAALGLRSPALVIDDVFVAGAEQSHQRILVVGSRDRYTFTASATVASGGRRSGSITMSPSLGWTLWWPFGIASSETQIWMTRLWLAVPLATIAFWSAAATKPREWLAALLPVGLAVLGANFAVPSLFDIPLLGTTFPALPLALGIFVGLVLGVFYRPDSVIYSASSEPPSPR